MKIHGAHVLTVRAFNDRGPIGYAVARRSSLLVRLVGRRRPIRVRSLRDCIRTFNRAGASGLSVGMLLTGHRDRTD